MVQQGTLSSSVSQREIAPGVIVAFPIERAQSVVQDDLHNHPDDNTSDSVIATSSPPIYRTRNVSILCSTTVYKWGLLSNSTLYILSCLILSHVQKHTCIYIQMQ